MSEFKFSCPECGQHILCDTRMSGTQITCPVCQKPVTIPAAPPGVPVPVAQVLPIGETAGVGAAPARTAPPPLPVSAPRADLPPPRAAAAARKDLPPPRAAAAAKPKQEDPSHYSKLAIASFVCSLFAFFGFIPGVICGHMAKTRMKKDVFLDGEKLANVGLAISYCVLAVTLVIGMIGMAERWHYHPTRTVLASGDVAPPAARLVDEVKITDTEEEHEQEGMNGSTSTTQGKKGRKASRGGYFSYVMKVSPTTPMSLNCLYWGDEPKGRFFDIAIDDHVIATQKLNHNYPGKFFDVEYKIPAALTHGKSEVTVVFQARPQWTAGTVYGLQTLKR